MYHTQGLVAVVFRIEYGQIDSVWLFGNEAGEWIVTGLGFREQGTRIVDIGSQTAGIGTVGMFQRSEEGGFGCIVDSGLVPVGKEVLLASAAQFFDECLLRLTRGPCICVHIGVSSNRGSGCIGSGLVAFSSCTGIRINCGQ